MNWLSILAVFMIILAWAEQAEKQRAHELELARIKCQVEMQK